MMNGTELHRMYQAWQQGNDHYVKDWFYFAQYAAGINNSTTEAVLKVLEKYYWFKKE
jgi:hypothetical protein